MSDSNPQPSQNDSDLEARLARLYTSCPPDPQYASRLESRLLGEYDRRARVSRRLVPLRGSFRTLAWVALLAVLAAGLALSIRNLLPVRAPLPAAQMTLTATPRSQPSPTGEISAPSLTPVLLGSPPWGQETPGSTPSLEAALTSTPSPVPLGVFALVFNPPLTLTYDPAQWEDMTKYANLDGNGNRLQSKALPNCSFAVGGNVEFNQHPTPVPIRLGNLNFDKMVWPADITGTRTASYWAKLPLPGYDSTDIPNFVIDSSQEQFARCQELVEGVLATLKSTPAGGQPQPAAAVLPDPFSLDDPAVQESLNAYLARTIGLSSFGGKVFCAHEPVANPAFNQDHSQAHIYLWAVCMEYYRDTWGLQRGSGSSIPVAILLTRDAGGYRFESYQVPGDGTAYGPDAQQIFPAISWSQILPVSQQDIDSYNARAQRLEDETLAAAEQAYPASPLPTMTPYSGGAESERRVTSPNGQWTAVFNISTGGLILEDASGRKQTLFPQTSLVTSAAWSPVNNLLAVSVSPAPASPGEQRVDEIWYGSPFSGIPMRILPAYALGDAAAAAKGTGEQIILGTWSPDSRYLTYWVGPRSASIQVDGLPLRVLDLKMEKANLVAGTTLVNPSYQSWAPDSSALAFTNGGDRSAQVGKWLSVYDAASETVKDLFTADQLVPGQVAWSPDGVQIAFAAVEAAKTGPDYAGYFGWDNPAILARRIYLISPAGGDAHSGQAHRLNAVEAYQDAPRWAGGQLLYVQINGGQAALMSAVPDTGSAQALPGCSASPPQAAGYYGQVDWSVLFQSCGA